jgi:hypothetical protein
MVMKQNAIKRLIFLMIMTAGMVLNVSGQNFTSTANGSWTTGANWGGSAPATSGQTWGTINVNHNMSINTNYSTAAGALNIAAGKQLTVNGNFSQASGITTTVSGILYITGNAVIDADLKIQPGGQVYVLGSATVKNSNYLAVGTNVAPPAYADLVIYGNYSSVSSGDITVNRNARVAIFGNVTDDGSGGSLFTINNGGQVYIDKDISFTGGGDKIINNNTTNPWGLYTNGTITNSGGGATTTANDADKATMKSSNPAFYNWAASVPNSPLPVTLIYFNVSEITENSVNLEWATAVEINFERFIVERSTNGSGFSEIGSLKGFGTTQERHNYSFADNNPINGRSYYRLKAVDYDGYFEYFNVIPVSYASAKKLSTFPNPSNGSFIELNLNFQPAADAQVQIFDATGLMLGKYPVGGFQNQINFSSNLIRGTYFIRYISSEHTEVIRFMVK